MKRLYLLLVVAILGMNTVQAAQTTQKKPIIIDRNQFNTLFKSGEIKITPDKILNINDNAEILVIHKEKGTKYLQPISIINGIMFCCNSAINEKSPNAILRLPLAALKEEQETFLRELFKAALSKPQIDQKNRLFQKLPFPNYFVVYRDAKEQKISLQYMTSLFRSTLQNLNNSNFWIALSSLSSFKPWKENILQIFRTEPTKFPDLLCKVMTICSYSKQLQFNYNPRKFKQDMEALFYTMYFLHARYLAESPANFDIMAFLKEVSDIRARLMMVYNANKPAEKYKDEFMINKKPVKRISLINDFLTCFQRNDKTSQSMKIEIRNSTAKALMMDTLTHVDQSPGEIYSKLLKLNKEDNILVKNYGQMADFITHIQDHKHVYHEGDKIPIIPEKSYFLLPKGKTVVDFYNTLYNAVIDADRSYNINNVQLKKSTEYGKDVHLIDIDIEFSADVQQKLATYMASTNGIDKLTQTTLIRFRIAEENGINNLITAYPTLMHIPTMVGNETRKKVYKSLALLFLDCEPNEQAQSDLKGTIYVVKES
ncbi:MAG: hypothetical protein IJS10_00255 [Alphaproteobacteria bacterium]|nr:hypothetical protein [Alphaproteobacteria bacterium]